MRRLLSQEESVDRSVRQTSTYHIGRASAQKMQAVWMLQVDGVHIRQSRRSTTATHSHAHLQVEWRASERSRSTFEQVQEVPPGDQGGMLTRRTRSALTKLWQFCCMMLGMEWHEASGRTNRLLRILCICMHAECTNAIQHPVHTSQGQGNQLYF